jgi:hypothetical protein
MHGLNICEATTMSWSCEQCLTVGSALNRKFTKFKEHWHGHEPVPETFS